MTQGGWPLLAAHVIFLASLLSVGGSLVFRAAVAPKAFAPMSPAETASVARALDRTAHLSLAAALVALAGWTLLQTVQMAGTLALLWPVLSGTVFGHVVLLQATFLAAVACMRARPALANAAALPALAAVAAEAGHGHGIAIGGLFGPLFLIEAIHVLAASIWIGGLVPLLLVVILAPPSAAAIAARRFSPIGKWAVALLAAAALLQGAWLVGSPHALTGTAYGTMLLVKAALFAVLLGFALLNRYRLAPRLRGAYPHAARRLITSIILQIAVGVCAILAASILSGLAPGLRQ